MVSESPKIARTLWFIHRERTTTAGKHTCVWQASQSFWQTDGFSVPSLRNNRLLICSVSDLAIQTHKAHTPKTDKQAPW